MAVLSQVFFICRQYYIDKALRELLEDKNVQEVCQMMFCLLTEDWYDKRTDVTSKSDKKRASSDIENDVQTQVKRVRVMSTRGGKAKSKDESSEVDEEREALNEITPKEKIPTRKQAPKKNVTSDDILMPRDSEAEEVQRQYKKLVADEKDLSNYVAKTGSLSKKQLQRVEEKKVELADRRNTLEYEMKTFHGITIEKE